jgi:transposase
MPTCNHCGAHVSDQFARVFADERGRVHACPSCSANAGIAEVARERAPEA